MQSSETLSNTDRTSWTRIWMFARYMWPALRPMIIIYPMLALVVTLLVNFMFTYISYEWAMQIMSIITIAVIVAPAFLSRLSNREAFYSLPVLGLEKCMAIFSIMFVGIYLLFVPARLLGFHIKEEFTLQMMNHNLELMSNGGLIIMSLLSVLAGEALALWTVFAAKTNRAIKSIFAGLSIFLVDGIIGFFVGFFTALLDLDIQTNLAATVPVVIIFWSIAFIFFAYKAARAISRKQL